MARKTAEQKLAAALAQAARLRHEISERRRTAENRRKYVVGGTILAAMEQDPELHARVVALLRQMVTRDLDKAVVSDLLGEDAAPSGETPLAFDVAAE